MTTEFEWWFSGFGMGITLADLRTVGKNPNISMWLKSSTRWIRDLREKFRIAGDEIPSVPRAGLVLRT